MQTVHPPASDESAALHAADAVRPTSLAEMSPDERLTYIVAMMREMSRQTDPQEMVSTYGEHVRRLWPSDGFVSLSRRGLAPGQYRITRSTVYENAGLDINPWRQSGQLPILSTGVLREMLYGEEPVVLDDFHVDPADPAYEHLRDYRSLVAVPLYDGGHSINMVVVFKREPYGFRHMELPERVWMANLFGRATQNLVLHEEVRRAYEVVDRELKAVADIQRSLLGTVPQIPTLELAAHYETSRQAGGDYYDFFPLPNGQWGILIADVSGHGTPAAVLMAITHSIAHTCDDPKSPPSRLLRFVNERLAAAYTAGSGNFVTAFYGVYDPPTRTLLYSNAGHPAPRVRRHETDRVEELLGASSLPLGIEPTEEYGDAQVRLEPGDALALYTDGITEARNAQLDMFGPERLDEYLCGCEGSASAIVQKMLASLDQFCTGQPVGDDRTLLVARVNDE